MTISVPSSCVESPRWVQVGVGAVSQVQSPTEADPEALGRGLEPGVRQCVGQLPEPLKATLTWGLASRLATFWQIAMERIAASGRLVDDRLPLFGSRRRLRGVDTGSLPPWRDGKRETLAP